MVDCPNCGGIHYGSPSCPYTVLPCIICKTPTIWACSDCAIGGSRIHICGNPSCRQKHEHVVHKEQP